MHLFLILKEKFIRLLLATICLLLATIILGATFARALALLVTGTIITAFGGSAFAI